MNTLEIHNVVRTYQRLLTLPASRPTTSGAGASGAPPDTVTISPAGRTGLHPASEATAPSTLGLEER